MGGWAWLELVDYDRMGVARVAIKYLSKSFIGPWLVFVSFRRPNNVADRSPDYFCARGINHHVEEFLKLQCNHWLPLEGYFDGDNSKYNENYNCPSPLSIMSSLWYSQRARRLARSSFPFILFCFNDVPFTVNLSPTSTHSFHPLTSFLFPLTFLMCAILLMCINVIVCLRIEYHIGVFIREYRCRESKA